MLFSINFCGGAGRHDGSTNSLFESLFYYFRIKDYIPEDHLLRLVDRHIDFTFVRETLKITYSHTGRPSIDPEVLLRILLIGYSYGITSERRLVEPRPHDHSRTTTGGRQSQSHRARVCGAG